jgi:hypothetical protein
MFLLIQALFLGFYLVLPQANRRDRWIIGAAMIAGAAPFLEFARTVSGPDCSPDAGVSTILLSAAGLIGLAIGVGRRGKQSMLSSVIVIVALLLT